MSGLRRFLCLLSGLCALMTACASGDIDGQPQARGESREMGARDLGERGERDQAGDMPDVGISDATPDEGQPPPTSCDVLVGGCGEHRGQRYKCALVQGQGRCVMDLEAVLEGEACSSPGQCADGLQCVVWSDERGGRCARPCAKDAMTAPCAAGQQCQGQLGAMSDVGLCDDVPMICDLVAQDCPQGQSCVLRRQASSGMLSPRCGLAGELMARQACGSGLGLCAGGLICISQEGAAARCALVCEQAASAGAQGSCPAPSMCQGQAASGVYFCR